MIARIKTKNGFYDSVVFAVFKKGWKSQVIVFNQNYDALEVVKMWKSGWTIKRSVFLYNTEKSADWTVEEKAEGYDWVLNNVSKRFFKTIINQNILDRCKQLQASVDNYEWFEIKNESDISELMDCAITFHDSYVKKMYTESQKQYILFEMWGCEILFELDGNIETNLFQDFGRIPIGNDFPLICDSAMFFEDDFIYWVDDESVQSSLNLDKSKYHYFCAKNIKWKLILA